VKNRLAILLYFCVCFILTLRLTEELMINLARQSAARAITYTPKHTLLSMKKTVTDPHESGTVESGNYVGYDSTWYDPFFSIRCTNEGKDRSILIYHKHVKRITKTKEWLKVEFKNDK